MIIFLWTVQFLHNGNQYDQYKILGTQDQTTKRRESQTRSLNQRTKEPKNWNKTKRPQKPEINKPQEHTLKGKKEGNLNQKRRKEGIKKNPAHDLVQKITSSFLSSPLPFPVAFGPFPLISLFPSPPFPGLPLFSISLRPLR